MNDSINIFLTGGTIMKTYDLRTGSVSNNNPLDVARMHAYLTDVARVSNIPFYLTGVFSKDSNEITQQNILTLKSHLIDSDARINIVIIGTDRMADIARTIGVIDDKTIIFVGAMIPMDFHNSDAGFNLGFVFGCVNYLPSGTYIAMNSQVFAYDKVVKNRDLAVFETENKTV